jgi:hypothetical protein
MRGIGWWSWVITAGWWCMANGGVRLMLCLVRCMCRTVVGGVTFVDGVDLVRLQGGRVGVALGDSSALPFAAHCRQDHCDGSS